MEGTDNTPVDLGALRRAALTAYNAGCEEFGPAFSTAPASEPAIAAYVDAVGPGKVVTTLEALRSSHESNCQRSHTLDTDDTDVDMLNSALDGLRAKE